MSLSVVLHALSLWLCSTTEKSFSSNATVNYIRTFRGLLDLCLVIGGSRSSLLVFFGGGDIFNTVHCSITHIAYDLKCCFNIQICISSRGRAGGYRRITVCMNFSISASPLFATASRQRRSLQPNARKESRRKCMLHFLKNPSTSEFMSEGELSKSSVRSM